MTLLLMFQITLIFHFSTLYTSKLLRRPFKNTAIPSPPFPFPTCGSLWLRGGLGALFQGQEAFPVPRAEQGGCRAHAGFDVASWMRCLSKEPTGCALRGTYPENVCFICSRISSPAVTKSNLRGPPLLRFFLTTALLCRFGWKSPRKLPWQCGDSELRIQGLLPKHSPLRRTGLPTCKYSLWRFPLRN